MLFTATDELFMPEALALAERGAGRTSPNPLVGALVVKDDRVVGRGYHQAAGGPHAEIHALREAGDAARGATLYVTLEPCNHTGRTGPCTDAVLDAGIARVVAAMRDPHPGHGDGAAKLRERGVQVDVGLCADEAEMQNAPWLTSVYRKRPRVIAKWAMTIDGKIATRTGHSRWVTGAAARAHTHQLRNRFDAILVGLGTVVADDPALTTRLPEGGGRDPIRIILDSHARIPLDAKVLTQQSEASTIVATTLPADHERVRRLEDAGATVWPLRAKQERVSWKALLQRAYKEEMQSIFVEGGPGVHASLWDDDVVDEVVCYVAPKICAGAEAPSPIGGSGVARMDRAPALTHVTTERLGDDTCIRGWVRPLRPEEDACSPA